MVLFATKSGGATVDADAHGGNPFASSLIEAASEPTLELRHLESTLRRLTLEKSNGFQTVDRIGDLALPNWRFVEDLDLPRERRIALVLIVSDYSDLSQNASLTGAAHDERRIAAILAQRGFSVEQGIGPRRKDLIEALVSFTRRSQRANIGVIYSTGHGLEVDGVVYLVPGDYPAQEGFGRAQLRRNAISVSRMTQAMSARSQNLVFFAGCRTLPD
jgi:hypothetical protein